MKKIVLWCSDAANQKALANRIQDAVGLSAIILEKRKSPPKKRTFTSLLKMLVDLIRFYPIHNAWHGLLRFYSKRYPSWPAVPLHVVDSINSEEARQLALQLQADLVVVSGTSLVKQPMLDILVSIGIINLHTGLSPYVKGGPNCTNWCIANNEWHLVGNTIMWINAGIDSGNIIATETVDIRSSNILLSAHIKVMDAAHDLYIRVIRYLLTASPPFVSVPQETIVEGKLYYTKMWQQPQKVSLLQNWKRRNKIKIEQLPKTISLPQRH